MGWTSCRPLHVRRRSEGLKRTFGGDHPLVLTCRSEEYRATVADCGALSAASVIEAEKVRLADVVEFLRGAFAADPRAAHRAFASLHAAFRFVSRACTRSTSEAMLSRLNISRA